ncbi:MAG: glycosyltransferase family 2 protein [Desulfobacteraceae bacterium]|nr:glycosyltransferase family 2 protein [Desulfobacteraceae bacterium]
MKISIFITSYNQKNYLKEAIESALAQTLPACQIIIVDDNSSDGSQELIGAFLSKYPHLIQPIYHRRNTGVAKVRFDALQYVKGDYVTYMDGDDRFLPTKIEKEASLLSGDRKIGIAFSNNYYMKADGTRTGVWIENEKPPVGDVFCQTFARDFPKRSLFRMELVHFRSWQEVGFHDQNLPLYEDFDIRIRLTKKLRAAYYDEPLSEIRFHGNGLSNSKFIEHFRSLNYIYRKNRHLLKDLTRHEELHVDRRLKDWIGHIANKAFVQCCAEGNRIRALSLLFSSRSFNPRLFSWSSVANILVSKQTSKT